MITIPNIDGKMWNIESKTAEIVFEMLHNDSIHIDLNSEGPCAESLKLYQLLDHLCEKFNYNKGQITINTCNQLERHAEYNIKKLAPLYIDSAQTFIKQHQHTFLEKSFDSNFFHFGIFIGRSNWLRLFLTSYLYQFHKTKTQLTFHYNPKLDFHLDHLGLDELIQIYPDWIEKINPLSLIKCSPIYNDEVDRYPIITPAHFAIGKLYHSFFVEIVCETYCQGQTFYPTEKIWRPIIMRTPFIVQGPQYYIENLHKLGFRTFSRWWDESHSQDIYSYQPLAIIKIIDTLAQLTTKDLEQMHNEMQETLDHNYKVMMSISRSDVFKAFS